MAKRKVNIGIITHNYPPNHKERKDAGIFLYDFAHELSKKARVFVLCPGMGDNNESDSQVQVTWFNCGGKKGEKMGDWSFFSPMSMIKFFKVLFFGSKATSQFVKENRLNYLLCAWVIPSGFFGWYANFRYKTPYAVWALGSDINKYARVPLLNLLVKSILTKSKTTFANSFALISKTRQIVKREVVFLPAITEFMDQKRKLTGRKKSKKFRFLFVGRLEKIKGPDILLEAVKFLREKTDSFEVHFLGDGNMKKGLEAYVEENELTGAVTFWGWADERKVFDFMTKSDALVVSSRSESLPLVMLEAAKVALPVIVTDVGDCRRMVQEYNIGCWVNKENPKALASKMYQMMKTDKRDKKQYGFKRLVRDFSQKQAVVTLLKWI